jgi:VWFA-related protein
MTVGPRAVLLPLLFASALTAVGQNANPTVFHTGTRIVLTDVTVLDAAGNPVRGLKQSDFTISDDGKRQKIKSFEAHADRARPILAESVKKAGMYSNAALQHPPAVVNVWLLDTTTIQMVNQMYFSHELTQMVNALPADEPVAIYWRAGQMMNLLQNFTSDHQLPLAAIHKAMPRMVTLDAQYTTDVDTLEQLIAALSDLPGRKNVMWFSGGSSMYLSRRADETPAPGLDLRPVFDGLEAERIAIYPIDVRGLTWATSDMMRDQHGAMEDVAVTTGGQAFYNNNDVPGAAAQFMGTDGSFYTLTYAPDDLHHDKKWHAVDVKVKGGYRLSFRHGYFDDDAEGRSVSAPTPKRPLLADGKAAEAPNTHLEAIIFKARVMAAADLPEEAADAGRGGAADTPAGASGAAATPPKPVSERRVTYSIRYFVPAAAFQQSVEDGKGAVTAGAAILAVNDYGRPVAHTIQAFKLNFDPQQLQAAPNGMLSLDQEIEVPKGQTYLYLAVWDTATGRVGTLQLSLDVTKPAQKAER